MPHMRHALIALLLATASVALLAQHNLGPEFDVVSINRSFDTSPRAGFKSTPGRFTMENRPISALVSFAFQVQVTGVIKGYPAWATNDRYNVIATMGGQHSAAETAAMLRHLLVERFKLATHTVTEKRNGLALVRINPDRVPAGLRKIDVDCLDPAQKLANLNARRTSPNDPVPPCLTTFVGRAMVSGGQEMSFFAQYIGALLAKSVVDETGLEGYYAFNVDACWTAVSAPGRDCGDAPELTTAIREQLGLRLVPRELTVTDLVIDHIERPTEN